jgi:very-short-patch-repair endonuclease
MMRRDWETQQHRGATAARDLCRRSTVAERALWELIRGRRIAGLKFRRQHPVRGWVLDFACIERQLAIEVDGSIHESQVEDDLRRTVSLQEMGNRVIRFSNDDVLCTIDSMLAAIAAAANSPSPAKRKRGLGGEGKLP